MERETRTVGSMQVAHLGVRVLLQASDIPGRRRELDRQREADDEVRETDEREGDRWGEQNICADLTKRT